MWSFTEAMAAAIDELTPYNASHAHKVAEYCGKIADYINLLHEQGKEDEYFSINRKEQLILGALLHDVGKLVTPLFVMNKTTRLEGREKDIENRLYIINLEAKIRFLEGDITSDYYEEIISKAKEALELSRLVNNAEPLEDTIKDRIKNVLDLVYDNGNTTIPFFTQDEKECISIETGTLTSGEREIMENHVVFTKKILDKVYFDSYFKNSPKWACEHHELLDGSGYPRHLTAKDLALESRIMTVADICDALMATDRPYKKSIPKEQVFSIMREMGKEGKIDIKIVEYLYQCIDM